MELFHPLCSLKALVSFDELAELVGVKVDEIKEVELNLVLFLLLFLSLR